MHPSRTIPKLLFLSLCIILLFMGCESSLSSGAVTDPSELRVNVVISHSVDYDGHVDETIEAFIRDKSGKTVANPQIRVKVNGKELSLNNGSSNYYGAYPSYRLTNSTEAVHTDTACTVTVMLTDGAEYTLGTVQTYPTLTPAHFSPPAAHSRRQALTVSWQDLESGNWLVRQWKQWTGETAETELHVSKSNKLVDQWGNVYYERSHTEETDFLTTTIGPERGSFTIPTWYLAGSPKPFNTLDIMISSQKTCEAGGPFLTGSTISSNRRSMYRIAVTNN